MTDHNSADEARPTAPDESHHRARRYFLLMLPAAVFAAIGTTLAHAAFRFIRPPFVQTDAGAAAHWTPLAPVTTLSGTEPLTRTLAVEHTAGWSRTHEERTVYVLPGENPPQVVSAICPHEGCEVAWRAEAHDFYCPCHDSRFSAAGARLSGPAQRDMERLPARVENGMLLVQDHRPAGESGSQPTHG